MSDSDRFFLTYDQRTGEPVGVVDNHRMPYRAMKSSATGAGTVSLPPKALMLLVGFALAAGMYVGILLFGDRTARSTVIVCPAPTEQVALRPAECGPPASRGVAR